jgi:hypothetical protein
MAAIWNGVRRVALVCPGVPERDEDPDLLLRGVPCWLSTAAQVSPHVGYDCPVLGLEYGGFS